MSYNLAGAGYGHGGGLFTNVGAILVLFILLVIITRAFI
ncbi:YjcZ family sporulation protein [Paenibacillus sp. KS-LC4]